MQVADDYEAIRRRMEELRGGDADDLYIDFDSDADVLSFSRGTAVPSYAAEDEQNPDIWYRYAVEDNSHIGLAIFRAKEFACLNRVAQMASSFLGISESQIRERLWLR